MSDRVMALRKIDMERDHQNIKWGEQNHHPLYWLGILAEETGEVAKAAIESNWSDYEKELIQVAAVAVAALEALWRASDYPAPSTEVQDGPG